MTTSRFRLASPRTALVLGGLTLLLLIAAVPLAVLSNGQSTGLLMAPFGIVGFLVAWRQSRNPIGWILLALTLAFLGSGDAGEYAVMVYRQGYHLPLGRPAVFLAAFWIWLIVLLPLPVALFPDGRVPGRWRWVLWCYLAVCATLVVGSTWQDAAGIGARHIRVDSSGELTSVDGSSGALSALGAASFLVFCAASVTRQVVAYSRSTGEYRQQLKWLLSGGAVYLTGLVLTLTFHLNFAFVAIIALPLGIGVGILKYRLYEIDRIISRTISYAIVTGLLVSAFVGLVVLTTRVLPFSSPLGVAASTLATAALFNPLRKRVQRLVDRRFNRARYNAQRTLEAFGARLRDQVDLETLSGELHDVVGQTMQPTSVSLWVRTTGTTP